MIIYTGTFDKTVSTTVHVCFTCTFIEGSQLLQQSIDVLFPSVKSSSQREATTIVPTSSVYPTNGRQPCIHEH